MITLTALFTLLYGYSIYKIRKDSGSWENFDPYESNSFSFLIFILSTPVIVAFILTLLVYAAYYGLIP
jgi:hypothetical protein